MTSIDICQHFRQEGYESTSQLTDKCGQAEQCYAPVLAHFLDPREQYILGVICGGYEDLNVSFYNRPSAEGRRTIISPSHYEPKKSDFGLTLMEIDYPERFVTLKYQHILGTLMFLDIERGQVGGITVNERTQFVLISRLELFIMSELQRIKGVPVKLCTIPVTGIIQSNGNWKNESTIASPLRLDVVIKEMVRKSHTIARQLIEKKRVKVNHTIVDSIDFQLQADDLISTQGLGKARITDLGGKAKKDKTRIACRILFKQ